MFKNKKVVLGVSGGIAAYKAADVTSWLAQNGAEVHCVMTEAAAKFISPVVLQALSGREVVIDEFVTGPGWGIVHIDLATDADLLAIIPATANIIAKIAHGIADDALTSTVLAATCPLFIAPAMNTHMFQNAATQQNLQTLSERGWHILQPAEGRLACGAVGAGKLPSVDVIKAELTNMLLPKQDFLGKKVLVTAGPTSEPIDPVRYISNRSSGKMGYAVAEAAKARGAEVVLVSGPVNIPAPVGVKVVPVGSALQMRRAVLAEYPDSDVVVKAAAVADYRVSDPADHKIKKTDDCDELILRLVKNPDILQELGSSKQQQFLVGFAAETNNVEEYARRKLQKKNADMLVANDVSRADAGFDVDTNKITIFEADGTKTEYPLASKRETADFILDAVLAGLAKRS
jgi:phosphopantothenoylcysteine decarboxylase/phosphopantothenate--cysteine ligase